MIKAVILDMDGTMIDSERQAALDWPAVGEKYGFHVDTEFIHSFLGLSGKNKVRLLKERLPHLDSEEVMMFYRSLTKTRFDKDGIIMKPGLEHLLKTSKAKGLILAVASAAPLIRIETILSDLNLRSYFDVLVGGDMITHQKPHPEIYQVTAHSLHLDCDECIVIEDSRVGIESAYRAKMHAILVPDVETPNTTMLSHCEACVPTLFEAVEVIESILANRTYKGE